MKKYSTLKHIDFLILDILSIIISTFIAIYTRHGVFSILSLEIYRNVLIVNIIFDIFIFVLLDSFKNVIKRGYLIEIEKTAANSLLLFLFTITYLYIVKNGNEYSRIILFLTYIIYIFISCIFRLIWKKYIRSIIKKDINIRKSIFIICKEKNIKDVINCINRDKIEYSIVGVCTTDSKNNVTMKKNGINFITKENLLSYASKNWIDEIFIFNNTINRKLLNELFLTNISIRFNVGEDYNFDGRKQIIEKFSKYYTISSVGIEYKKIDMIFKRLIDIFGGIIGCFITLILFIIIGPIIYVKSPGPIIYVSKRVGKNGRIFKFYKFRSMILNADELKDNYLNKNRIKDGMMFKIENDPRIIPGIGNFIRKTSIDEFPQFFNVLKGDMSIVGTRPPTLDEWNRYTPYYRSRMSIKPGITGMWQISGRSEITDFNEVVKLDNEYINNFSISLDIKIIFKTIKNIFSKEKEGAM